MSHSGTRQRRGPGIQSYTARLCRLAMDSGFAASRRPGMTNYAFIRSMYFANAASCAFTASLVG
jgi:hypothetical protein